MLPGTGPSDAAAPVAKQACQLSGACLSVGRGVLVSCTIRALNRQADPTFSPEIMISPQTASSFFIFRDEASFIAFPRVVYIPVCVRMDRVLHRRSVNESLQSSPTFSCRSVLRFAASPKSHQQTKDAAIGERWTSPQVIRRPLQRISVFGAGEPHP
jgi:hypothetical protein